MCTVQWSKLPVFSEDLESESWCRLVTTRLAPAEKRKKRKTRKKKEKKEFLFNSFIVKIK
jgi:hypothetical protein